MFQFIKNKMTDIGFVLLLIICFYFLNFHSYFFAQPQGVHFNRQIDGLSFVSNYYHNGFDFFHPELYNLIIKEKNMENNNQNECDDSQRSPQEL